MEANTTIRITGAPTGGRIKAIPSKSAAHRILIAAALSGLDLRNHCEGLSKDITATKECLAALMSAKAEADAPKSRKTYASAGQSRDPAPGIRALLPCGESGSTLRFLIPAAGVLGIDADFICEGRLPDRPMQPFLEALAQQGCQVSGYNPKQLRGRLHGGTFHLPGNISSQYVTGLLMALPLAEEDSWILVEGTLQSRPYIDLTLEVLAKAGIRIGERTVLDMGSEDGTEPGTAKAGHTAASSTVFEVPGRQRYQLPEDALEHIEGDWSNGAFWMVMDAMLRRQEPGLPEQIRCTGLDPDSLQGDKAIVDVIERIHSADSLILREQPDGCRSLMTSSEAGRLDISVTGRSGFVEIDASDIPDLVPAISALACGRPAGAVTHIVKAGRLRLKESDRLRTVTKTLQALGADITEEQEGLMIRGSRWLTGGDVSSCGDHRIAMMAGAAACITEGEILIRDAEAVEKSYPGFWEDYRLLGGRWERMDSMQSEVSGTGK